MAKQYWAWAMIAMLPATSWADQPTDIRPRSAALMDDVPSVYAPPAPPSPEEGVNLGGVNIELRVNYLTDYIYRGIEILEVPASEDKANLQFEGKLNWNLGKLPSPFIGIFTNVAELDPVSEFQEIRPFFGFDLDLRPFTLTFGNNTYLYPDRDDMNTAEVWGRITLDDSWLFSTRKPLLSPYVMAAYDYDNYDGWYLEAGVSHEIELEEIGVTLEFYGHVAYVHEFSLFSLTPGEDSGFQHYQVGVIGKYSLNKLLNTSERYGSWHLIGYLNYTDGIDEDLRAEEQLWGGAAIGFRY